MGSSALAWHSDCQHRWSRSVRHNKRRGVSNQLYLDCLLSRLFRRASKKTSKLRVTGIWPGPVYSPHKGPVMRQVFPFDDVVMIMWFVRLLIIDGILPKWPYPPCLRMADMALLAGYPRYQEHIAVPTMYVTVATNGNAKCRCPLGDALPLIIQKRVWIHGNAQCWKYITQCWPDCSWSTKPHGWNHACIQAIAWVILIRHIALRDCVVCYPK